MADQERRANLDTVSAIEPGSAFATFATSGHQTWERPSGAGPAWPGATRVFSLSRAVPVRARRKRRARTSGRPGATMRAARNTDVAVRVVRRPCGSRGLDRALRDGGIVRRPERRTQPAHEPLLLGPAPPVQRHDIGDDSVRLIDTGANPVVARITVAAPAGALRQRPRDRGASPNALAFSADERSLCVPDGGATAVAGGAPRPAGGVTTALPPTGWCPNAVAATR